MRFFAIVVLSSLVACPLEAVDVVPDRTRVQRQKMMKLFSDTSRDRALCASQEWVLCAVFQDLDSDGREEALVGLPFEDNDVWHLVSWAGDAAVREGDVSNVGIGMSLRLRNFYHINFEGVPSGRLCGHDVTVYEMGPQGAKRTWTETLLLAMRPDGGLGRRPLKDGMDSLVANPGFLSLGRVAGEVYRGYEMKLVKGRYDARQSPPPERWLRPRGGIVCPVNFDVFARHYREEVKARLGCTKKNAVYAVFFDVDDDGDADFYVSSEVERANGDNYRWTLYLNDKGTYTRATETVWFWRELSNRSSAFEPEVVATRQAFHRVVSDCWKPAFAVLDVVGRRICSQSYSKYLTEEERLCRPHDGCARGDGDSAFHQWNSRVKMRLGGIVPFEFRELFDCLDVQTLERLPCAVYPEP